MKLISSRGPIKINKVYWSTGDVENPIKNEKLFNIDTNHVSALNKNIYKYLLKKYK